MVPWQLISGSDPAKPCTLCGELTQNHFWGCFKEGAEEFAMAYYFCDGTCVGNFRRILGTEEMEIE